MRELQMSTSQIQHAAVGQRYFITFAGAERGYFPNSDKPVILLANWLLTSLKNNQLID